MDRAENADSTQNISTFVDDHGPNDAETDPVTSNFEVALANFALRRLEFIARMTGTLVGSQTLARSAQQLAFQIQECFQVDACVIRVVDGSDMLLLGAAGVPDAELPARIPIGGIGERLLATREPLVIPNVHQHPLTRTLVQEKPGTYKFMSYAGVPLLMGDKAMGVLGIYTMHEARLFTELDVQHLQIVANHVSTVLSNERLFDQVEAQRAQLKAKVAQREESEMALRASEARLRAIFETEPECVKLLAADGTLLEMNPAGLRMLEASSFQEVKNHCVYPIVAPQHRAAFRELTAKVFRGESGMLEFQIVGLKGRPLWLETHASPLRDANGKIIALLGITRDVTRRKEADRALRESEMRLRLVGQIIVAFSFSYAVAPDNSVHLEWATPPIEQVTGYTEEEFRNKISFRSRIHPDDRAAQQAALNRVFAGRAEMMEFRLLTKAGQYRWLQCYNRPEWSESEQRVVRVVGASQDITARKEAEEALRQLSARLLQLQDEERRRIARELHDNTAQHLAALSMNLSSLKKALGGDATAAQTLVESVALVESAAQEIRTMSYLLHPPVLEEVGLVSALRDYANGLTRRSGVRIRVIADPSLARFGKERELALFRVAQEALGNVIRHSGSSTAEVFLEKKDENIRLEVRDRGRGISTEKLALFRSAGAEIGVGIAGMLERLRQLGGTLEIESNPDGTAVRARIPS